MTCQEARIQAYLDGELSRDERKELSRHLQHCKPCQLTLAELKRLAEWSDIALHDALAPLPQEQTLHIDTVAAWATFEAKLQAKRSAEQANAFVTETARTWQVPAPVSMHEQSIQTPATQAKGRWSTMAKTYQKWIAGGAAAAVVVGALMIPQVQAATSDLLHLFRVEKFQMISFNDSDIQSIESFIKDGKIGQKDLAGLGKIEMEGDKNEVSTYYSAADAQKKGLAAAVTPSGYQLQGVQVSPSRTMKMTVNVPKMNSLLANLGSEVQFDSNIDNKPFTLAIPQEVETVYNSTSNATVKLHYGLSNTPTMQVPADVDVKKLRTTILGLPFLPEHIKQQLEAIQDWQTTVPIPEVESASGLHTEKLTVGGAEGIYTAIDPQNGMLIWQSGGKMHRLTLEGWNSQMGDLKQALLKQAQQFQ